MSVDIEAETRRLALELVDQLTTLVCQSALELVQDALASPIAQNQSFNASVRAQKSVTLARGKLQLDPNERMVRVAGQEARLTRTEYRIFDYLAGRMGQWVPSDEIRRRVLGQKVSSTNRVDQPLLRVHVSNIRRKLGRAAKAVVSDRTRGLRLDLKKT
jgi:DNA-binding response OmpR family regulator